jgi:hypothetical protein
MKISVRLTSAAAKSFIKDLKANKCQYTEITPTNFEMEETAKIRLAIRMVKERFGAQSIKVSNL